MPQQPEIDAKACWDRKPPSCPVRVPLSFHAAVPGASVEVRIGMLEGGDGSARVILGELEFVALDRASITDASVDAVSQLAECIELDLAVGGVVRKIIGRKPVLAKAIRVAVHVLMRYAEGREREVLRGLINREAYTSRTTSSSS